MNSAAKKLKPASKQNVTLRIRSNILAEARTLAAERDTSLSELFERLTQEASVRLAANEARKRELIELARIGIPMGGGPYLTRDEIYDRHYPRRDP